MPTQAVHICLAAMFLLLIWASDPVSAQAQEPVPTPVITDPVPTSSPAGGETRQRIEILEKRLAELERAETTVSKAFLQQIEAIDRQISTQVQTLSASVADFASHLTYISWVVVVLVALFTGYDLYKLRNLEGNLMEKIRNISTDLTNTIDNVKIGTEKSLNDIKSGLAGDITKNYQVVLAEVENIRTALRAEFDATKQNMERANDLHFKLARHDLDAHITAHIDRQMRRSVETRFTRLEEAYSANLALIEDVLQSYLENEAQAATVQNPIAGIYGFNSFRVLLTHLISGDSRRVLGALGRIEGEHFAHLSDLTVHHLQGLLCRLKASGRLNGRNVGEAADELLMLCEKKTGRSCQDFQADELSSSRRVRVRT